MIPIVSGKKIKEIFDRINRINMIFFKSGKSQNKNPLSLL
jgi:hypothetical protein